MRTSVIIVGLLLAGQVGCNLSYDWRVPNPDARIVVFGDSATRGPAEADFSTLLPGLLELPDEAVANEGTSGENTAEGIVRLVRTVDRDLYPNATALIYWQGGTDLIDFVRANDPLLFRFNSPLFQVVLAEELDRIEANLMMVADTAAAAGWQLYLLTYFPLSAEAPCPLVPGGVVTAAQTTTINAYQVALNARIRDVAIARDLVLIDVATIGEDLLADCDSYFDCNHLSAAGNARVADLVAAALGAGTSE